MALQEIHLDLAPAGLHLASPSAWKRWGFTREWVFQHNLLKICCRDNDPIYATVLHTMFLMPRLQLLSSFQLSPTLSDYHANGEWFNSLDLNSLCPWLSDSKEISRRLLIWTWEPHQCPHKHDVNGRKSREQLGTQTYADTVSNWCWCATKLPSKIWVLSTQMFQFETKQTVSRWTTLPAVSCWYHAWPLNT